MIMVEDAPENVRLVVVVRFQGVPTFPLSVHVVEPSVRERVLELLPSNVEVVRLLPLVSSAPLVSVQTDEPFENASCSVQPPPTPSKVMSPGFLPLKVMVLPVAVA